MFLLFGAFKKEFECHLKHFDLNKLGVFKFTTELKKKLLPDKKKKKKKNTHKVKPTLWYATVKRWLI